MVNQNKKKENLKESKQTQPSQMKPSEENNSISNPNLLETSDIIQEGPIFKSYAESFSNINVLKDVKICVNIKNIKTSEDLSIIPNAPINVVARMLHKMSINIQVASSGVLNDRNSLQQINSLQFF